jgi:ERCC4-type nuclease
MRYHFTDTEIKKLMNGLVVLVDTREQENTHILSYLDQKKIPYEVRKLNFGDYSIKLAKNEEFGLSRDLYFDNSIVVERKGSLDELAGNLTKDRARFESELLRAKGTNMSLLVENANYSDVVMGKYRSDYNAKSFVATLSTYSARYGLDVAFVEREFAGNWIYHRLYYAVREELLHG